MGLSASQARLLSITARLSDNELHSQQIANAKIRLADQSQQASREYVNALDTQKLMYTTYDSKGNATQVNLTPALMYDFGEMKNQYGISNAAGQLLISSTDAMHYKSSANLIEFLQSYGVNMKHNEAYDEMLKIIYSDRTDLYDPDNAYEYVNIGLFDNLKSSIENATLVNRPDGDATADTVEEWKQYVKNCTNATSFINWYNKGMEGLSFFGGTETEATLYGIHNDVNSDDPQYTYGTTFTNYVESLYNVPVFDSNIQVPVAPKALTPEDFGITGEKPADFADPEPDPADPTYADKVLSPVCWSLTGIVTLMNQARNDQTLTTMSSSQIEHVEHVMAQYLWSDGYGAEETIDTKYGTMVNEAGGYGNMEYWGVGYGGAYKSARPTLAEVDPNNIQTVTLSKPENATLKEELQELYCKILIFKNHEWGQLYGGSVTQKTGNGVWSKAKEDLTEDDKVAMREEITASYTELMIKLATAAAKDSREFIDAHEKWETDKKATEAAQADWESKMAAYENYINNEYPALLGAYQAQAIEYANEVNKFIKTTLPSWVQSVEYHQNNYKSLIDNLPKSEILDDTDPKVAWYTNLWHRINGPSETNTNVKLKDGKLELDMDATANARWKVLDDKSLKSAAWLQYALEQGVVTFEQVQKADDIETETGLTTTKWQSKSFTSCTDIQFVDDTTAIARAEAEYTRKLNDIEAKDKKYDNDIKKLDTEHNALQTEYESVKSVIDKNIERSFKAFS